MTSGHQVLSVEGVILQPIARASIADEVFAQLSRQILDDTINPGQELPSERALAEAFGVSRPVVREALRKLEQAGLVSVRQGGATSVLDFRRHAGPEVLPLLVAPGGQLDVKVVTSVMEARQAIGVEVAGLAARHGGDAKTLQRLVEEVAAQADPVGRQRAALLFWEQLVNTADSLAYRLIFNSLRKVYEPAMEALVMVMAAETSRTDLYQQLCTAIAARDEPAARSHAGALLTCGTTAFSEAMNALQQ